jgi:hypothetical protein
VGAFNDFSCLLEECGSFETNLNSQGFPSPVTLTASYGWIPPNAVHLASVPVTDDTPSGEIEHRSIAVASS